MSEEFLIRLAHEAGFRLVAKSEVNARGDGCVVAPTECLRKRLC